MIRGGSGFDIGGRSGKKQLAKPRLHGVARCCRNALERKGATMRCSSFIGHGAAGALVGRPTDTNTKTIQLRPEASRDGSYARNRCRGANSCGCLGIMSYRFPREVGTDPTCRGISFRNPRQLRRLGKREMTRMQSRQFAMSASVAVNSRALLDRVTRNDLAIPLRTELGCARLGFEVNVVKAESLAVTVRPLVIVEQAPEEVALNRIAL